VTGGAGGAGVTGTTGEDVAGAAGVGGASAEILFVRNETMLLRAFSAPVDGAVSPPAAGSISSSHAPHSVTESTYATSELLFATATLEAVTNKNINIKISVNFCVCTSCLHAWVIVLLIWFSSF